MDTQPNNMQMYGNAVTVIPADSTLYTEVYRAPDNGSGAPNDGASISCTVLKPGPLGGITFIDPLPNDNAKRYYKSRHVDLNDNQSTFTAYSDGQVPTLITSTNLANPMAAFGAIVDALPPSTLYEMRMAGTYPDPDTIDGLQSYIDFPATTNFMRVGQTPLALVSSTAVNPSVVTVTNHGFMSGDKVTIRGHLTNTAINSTWTVTVITNDTFSVPVLGNGTGGATGHVVKLSLTIDSVGNLIVYAIVQAVSLVVNGIATFNSTLRALGGTLVRSLQHSATGEYGATNVLRMLFENAVLKAKGLIDTAGAFRTDGDNAWLGTYGVSSAPTARTTANQGAGSGWSPTSGAISNPGSTKGTFTLAAGSRPVNSVGDPTYGTNAVAYDNNYALTFQVTADMGTLGGSDPGIQTTVQVEYSTNGGSSYTTLSPTYSVFADTTTAAVVNQTFTPVVSVAGNTTTKFRLLVSISVTCPGLMVGSGTGTATVGTSYPTTWSTGSTFWRRGLKLFATDNGTDKLPHAYLEPLTAATPDANAAEGEIEYVGDPVHALLVHDAAKFCRLGRTVFQDANKTTTNTVEGSLTSFTLKANTLGTNGQMLVVVLHGQNVGGTSGTIKIQLGGTNFSAKTYGINAWTTICFITRTTGASVQVASSVQFDNATLSVARQAGVVNLGADATLDIRALVVGACTLTLDGVTVFVL